MSSRCRARSPKAASCRSMRALPERFPASSPCFRTRTPHSLHRLMMPNWRCSNQTPSPIMVSSSLPWSPRRPRSRARPRAWSSSATRSSHTTSNCAPIAAISPHRRDSSLATSLIRRAGMSRPHSLRRPSRSITPIRRHLTTTIRSNRTRPPPSGAMRASLSTMQTRAHTPSGMPWPRHSDSRPSACASSRAMSAAASAPRGSRIRT
jgi:hypothetical protein